jgi:hypothetical protein
MSRLISCKDASRLISQTMDGPLPLHRYLLLRLHLLFCDACTEFRRQVRFLRKTMRRYRQ